MDNELMKKAASFTEAKNLISVGDAIVAGISGGADSVCLLFLLCELRKEMDLKLFAVHVNHGIRENASRDAAYVRQLCEKWDVPFYLYEKDIPSLSKELGLSEEETGRRVRYEAFEETAQRVKNELSVVSDFGPSGREREVKIAVAHNMNDNAETVLFNLFRGSALKGLTGIPVSREGKFRIVRPLLCLERSEIEEILKCFGLEYVTDETNEENIYSRNRIRHDILPVAEEIAPGAVRRILSSSQILAETEDFLETEEKEAFERCASFRGGNVKTPAEAESAVEVILDCGKLSCCHIAIQKRVLHRALRIVTSGGRDIGALQIEQLLDLLLREGNRKLDLARGVAAKREYDKIVISSKEGGFAGDESEKEISGKLISKIIPGENFNLNLEDFKKTAGANKYTKLFDCDKIDGPFELRKRKTGDYIAVKRSDGTYGKKSLKQYMIDAKIPPSERDLIPVVAVYDKCIWLVGYRTSDDLFIDENTKTILSLTYER
jgi:tRNA(Ile)-lysidine synthase